MLRCVIVDDESGAIEILTQYVKQTPNLELLGSFRDAIEALTFLSQHHVDLAFLDIDMPELNGIQLSDLMKKDTMVIFCTAYSEYAVESYEQEAVDYLLKPIAFNRFLKAVSKAEERSQQSHSKKGIDSSGSISKLFIKSGSKIHQLDTGDLLYMEKGGHYIEFHTHKGTFLSRMNMKELLTTLPGANFVRIHKSYVVAVDKIDTVLKHDVIIAGKEIPIGESFKKNLFDKISFSGK